MGSTSRVQFPAMQHFSVPHIVRSNCGAHLAFYRIGVGSSFTEDKSQKCEVDTHLHLVPGHESSKVTNLLLPYILSPNRIFICPSKKTGYCNLTLIKVTLSRNPNGSLLRTQTNSHWSLSLASLIKFEL
jgi:hypothetical protein